jgi:hypothetical protein
MRSFAVGYHEELKAQQPSLSLTENLDMVTEEVKRRFPDKFENDRRRAPATTAGADNSARTESPRGGVRGRTVADLPPEAKAAHDRFTKQMVKDKAGKMVPFITSEQFLKDYQWD